MAQMFDALYFFRDGGVLAQAFLVRAKIPGADKRTLDSGQAAAGFCEMGTDRCGRAWNFPDLAVRESSAKKEIGQVFKIIPDRCPCAAEIPAMGAGDGTEGVHGAGQACQKVLDFSGKGADRLKGVTMHLFHGMEKKENLPPV